MMTSTDLGLDFDAFMRGTSLVFSLYQSLTLV